MDMLPPKYEVENIKILKTLNNTSRVLGELKGEIKKMQEIVSPNHPIRKVSGTVLKNPDTQEVVYTPPQNHNHIKELLRNLEKYINEPDFHKIDPLIKMPIIHYQFESIHPFYDGNGRTGRILNMLYLVQQELLDIPVLYLSSFIIRNKADYYRLLQEVRTEDKWEEWVIWMLKGVHRNTSSTYLNALADGENAFLTKVKVGKNNYFVNDRLLRILKNRL